VSNSDRPNGQLSILVVDDDDQVRSALTDILQLDDHHVTTAEDGCVALRHLKSSHFDLMITDLGMPGMSGLELAGQAVTLDPTIQIIIVTGYGAKITEEERAANRIIGVMPKPFRINQLHEYLDLMV
jgi:DNA-binding NtrC family response regulator